MALFKFTLQILKIYLFFSNNWKHCCFNCSRCFHKTRLWLKMISSKWNHALSFAFPLIYIIKIYIKRGWKWKSLNCNLLVFLVFKSVLVLPELFLVELCFEDGWLWGLRTLDCCNNWKPKPYIPTLHFESLIPLDFSWRTWF